MINSTSEQVFLSSNDQNYGPNIFPSSSKMLNVNLNDFQALNSVYSKSKSHKKINAVLLTDQNVNSRNVQKAIINNPQLMKTNYNNAYSTNKKLIQNIDFNIKYSSAQRMRCPSENFNTLNFQNSAIKGEMKNDFKLYNKKM